MNCLKIALDVGILYNDSSVASGEVYSYAGKEFSVPFLCGVNPDSINFNSQLNIQWKYGNNGNPIPALSSKSDIGQSKTNNLSSLHIIRASSRDRTYSCHFTWIDGTKKSLVFNLNINGEQQAYQIDSLKRVFVVDCRWSEWSHCSGQCGVGRRSRTSADSVRKHRGKSCSGSSMEDCDTGIPCK